MNKKVKQMIILLLSVLFVYWMFFISFEEKAIFWYLYTFTILVAMSIAIISGPFKDELPTWKYLLYGIGYGTISYGIIRLGYLIIGIFDNQIEKNVHQFTTQFGPNTSWHYLLLIFIIAIGEELFWRGYVQQQLKHWLNSSLAVVIASILFSIPMITNGFYYGAFVAFIVGLMWGFLYEWKKSIPLVIIAHETFILLLFLILPF